VRYLLDADSAIDHFGRAIDLARALPDLGSRDLAMSAVTLIELYTSVYGSRDPARAERQLRHFLRTLTLIPLNQRVILATARVRHDLLSRRLSIKPRAYDLIVAATALEYGLTLVTSNTRDYQDVAGLTLFNPRTIA